MKKFSVLCLILALAIILMTGTARANLLNNPGFELADTDPNDWMDPCHPEPNSWDFQASNDPNWPIYQSTGGRTGKYVEILVPSNAWSVCYQHRNIAEQIPYTFKAWVKAGPMQGDGKAELKIEFKDWNYGLIDQNTAMYDVNTTWTQKTLYSMVAPIGTRLVACTVSSGAVGAYADGVDLCFDDVSLTTNPPDLELTDCQEAQFQSNWDFAVGDLNRDCVQDFKDYAMFAENWLKCNAVTAGCTQNW